MSLSSNDNTSPASSFVSSESQRTVAGKVGVVQGCMRNVAKKIYGGLPVKNVPEQGRRRVSTKRDDGQCYKSAQAGEVASQSDS